MASNNISFVRGTTEAFEVDIVDEAGKAIPSADLEGAVAQFVIRTAPDAPTTVLTLVPVVNTAKSTLLISIASGDTSSLALGIYVYQVSITLADGSYYDVIDYSVFDLNLGGWPSVTAFELLQLLSCLPECCDIVLVDVSLLDRQVDLQPVKKCQLLLDEG